MIPPSRGWSVRLRQADVHGSSQGSQQTFRARIARESVVVELVEAHSTGDGLRRQALVGQIPLNRRQERVSGLHLTSSNEWVGRNPCAPSKTRWRGRTVRHPARSREGELGRAPGLDQLPMTSASLAIAASFCGSYPMWPVRLDHDRPAVGSPPGQGVAPLTLRAQVAGSMTWVLSPCRVTSGRTAVDDGAQHSI